MLTLLRNGILMLFMKNYHKFKIEFYIYKHLLPYN